MGDQRGLPTPDKWLNIDYAKDAASKGDHDASSASLLAPTRNIASARNSPREFGTAPGAAADTVKATSKAARKAKSPSSEGAGTGRSITPLVVDYEELVRDGQTESPFLLAEKDAVDT